VKKKRRHIKWKGQHLVWSPEHHGYIDPDEHGGPNDVNFRPTIWRFRRRGRRRHFRPRRPRPKEHAYDFEYKRRRTPLGKKFKILNGIKYLGGGVFSIGCIITWVAFVGPFVARYVMPDLAFDSLAIWEKGILLTCVGFALLFLGWILSKSSSQYGFRYRDWRAKRVGRVMGSLFVFTVIVWLVSLIALKIQPALIIFADARPMIWIFGILATFILFGYIEKTWAGKMRILDLFSPALTFLGALGVFGAFAFVWYGIPLLSKTRTF